METQKYFFLHHKRIYIKGFNDNNIEKGIRIDKNERSKKGIRPGVLQG